MSALDLDFSNLSWVDVTPHHERPRQVRLTSNRDSLTFKINDALAEEMKITSAKLGVKVSFAEVKKGVFAARITPQKSGEYTVHKKTEGEKVKSVVYEVTVKVMVPQTAIRNVLCEFKADGAGIVILMPDGYIPSDHARFFGIQNDKAMTRNAAE